MKNKAKKRISLLLSLILAAGLFIQALPATLATENEDGIIIEEEAYPATIVEETPSVPDNNVDDDEVDDDEIEDNTDPTQGTTPVENGEQPSENNNTDPAEPVPVPSIEGDTDTDEEAEEADEEVKEEGEPEWYEELLPAEDNVTQETAEEVTAFQITECECENAWLNQHEVTCENWIFNAEEAYEYLMCLETEEEINNFLLSFSPEKQEEIISYITDNDMEYLAQKFGYDLSEEIYTPPVNYIYVGELMPPVTVESSFSEYKIDNKVKSLKKSVKASINEVTNNNDGLVLSKKAEPTDNPGEYKITMEAYTTGSVTLSTSAVPTDIVLVLDESGSMAYKMSQYTEVYALNQNKTYYVKQENSYIKVEYCNGKHFLIQNHDAGWFSVYHGLLIHSNSRYYPKESINDTNPSHVQFYEENNNTSDTRNAALKNAVTNFVYGVNADAYANNVDHRISVIGFSNAAQVKIGLTGDIRNNLSEVLTAVTNLNTDGGTYIDDGADKAKNVFDNASATPSTTRNRVVIFFTDGIPGTGDWDDLASRNCANYAIDYSNDLKKVYGATVYTIGMVGGANPWLEISDEDSDDDRTNKFLHYLSSNYPNAMNMNNGGIGSNSGYYLAAGDTESLNSIFEQIQEQIAAPSIDLGESAVVFDTVSPYFVAPENYTDINVYSVECIDYNDYTGYATWSPTPTQISTDITVENDVISVTGFDFNENFVTENPKDDLSHGAKLVIEFTIQTKTGFIGGNGVPTNGTAGVYIDENSDVPIKTFDVPTVDIPIDVSEFTVADKTIYKGNSIAVSELYQLPEISEENEWKYAFITRTETNPFAEISDQHGNISPNECTTYEITVTYAPIYDGTFKSIDVNKTATIHVLQPVVNVTVNDVVAYYGETYILGNGFGDDIITADWLEVNTDHVNIPKAIGTPKFDHKNLSIVYSVDSVTTPVTVGKTDFDVNVTVMNGDKPVDAVITTTCDIVGAGCTEHNDGTYKVHVKTCSLNITKTGGASGEPYVFTIYKGTDHQKYTEVTVESGESVEICELPVGTYSIVEDTGWSWRYTASYNNNSVTLDTSNSSGEIICTNEKTKHSWLNGFSKIIRNIFGSANNFGNPESDR